MSADAILAELFSAKAHAEPYPYYEALRQLGRIVPLQSSQPGTTPFAAVSTDYEVIDGILRGTDFYKNTWRDTEGHPLLTTFSSSMVFSNPPDHGRMRRVFQRLFTPRRVGDLEPAVERITDGLLDRMAESGAGGTVIDFVAEFALLLPSLVTAELIGLPVDSLDWYRSQVKAIDAYLDIDGKNPRSLAAADAAASDLREFYAELIALRRRAPRGDLISDLVAAVDAGDEPITGDELISNLIVLYNASYVTTVYLLSSGLPLLLRRPDVLATLAAGDPVFAEACVDEILRCESPIQFMTRAASTALEVEGVPIKQDGVVLMLLGAANRDPARFPDPDVFDPYRPDTGSLAFSAGIHYCLGAAVARREGRIALPRLIRRFPDLAVAGPPVRSGSLMVYGTDSLPVTLGTR